MRSRLGFLVLRVLGVTYGFAIMLGEVLRSWGAGRHLAWILDDFVVGLPLIVSAILVGRANLRRRLAFSASWAANAAMVYSSFFQKLLEPERTEAGNASAESLMFGAGFALVQCVICTLASIVIDPSLDDSRQDAA